MNNSKLTSSELTVLHTELIDAARNARTLANISRRAASLIADGYQVRPYGTDAEKGLYVVESPKGDKYVVWHGVKVGYECSCPAFAKFTTCKHLEGIDLLKQEAAQAEDADREAEAAEDASWYLAELASRY